MEGMITSRVRKPEMDKQTKNLLKKILKTITFMFKVIYLILIAYYCFIFGVYKTYKKIKCCKIVFDYNM